MEFAEREAVRRQLGRLILYTNEAMTENHAIYTHLGYREIERRTEDGYQRIYMEKILLPRQAGTGMSIRSGHYGTAGLVGRPRTRLCSGGQIRVSVCTDG